MQAVGNRTTMAGTAERVLASGGRTRKGHRTALTKHLFGNNYYELIFSDRTEVLETAEYSGGEDLDHTVEADPGWHRA